MSIFFINRYLAVVLFCALSASAISSELDQIISADTLEFAEGYDKRLRYAPRTVVIMERDRIERSGALNVAELLERIVGIHVTRSSANANADTFVRGISGNWLILHNGVEIERTLPDLNSLPVADIERLEVLKGSHFAIYGPSAIVGTLNIVTFSPDENKTTVSARAGTLDTKEAWLRKSQTHGDYGYSAFIYHSDTDGSRQIVESDRQSDFDEQLGTSASFAPSRAYFDRQLTDARFTLELGPTFTLHQYFTHRRSGVGTGIVQSIDPQGKENLTRFATDIRYSKKISRGAMDVHLAYNHEKASFDDAYFLPPGALGGLFTDGVLQSYGQTGQELTAELITRLVLGKHNVELGIGSRHGVATNDYDRRNYTVQNGSPIPVPAGPVQDYIDGDALFDREYSNSGAHILIRDQYRFTHDLALDAGLRIDYDKDYGTVVNPRLGLEWTAGQYTDITLLYGESSILPTVIQQSSNGIFTALGDRNLKPAKIRMIELAINKTISPALALDANIFTYRQADDIGTTPDTDSPNGSRFANLSGNEVGHGFELLLNWQPSTPWSVSAGVAFQRNTTVNSDNETAPQWQPYLESTYQTLSDWTTNISVFGVGQRDRRDGDLRADIDNYTITNVAIQSPRLFANTQITLDIQNVFDVDAREDVATEIENDVPVWPQRVLIGINSTF